MNKFQEAISKNRKVINELNNVLDETKEKISNDISNNKQLTDQLLDAYNFMDFAISLKQMCHYFICVCNQLIDDGKMPADDDVKNHVDIIYEKLYSEEWIPEKIKKISKEYLDDFVFERVDCRKILKKKQFDLNNENRGVSIICEII